MGLLGALQKLQNNEKKVNNLSDLRYDYFVAKTIG
jgi:hypothetical protein